MCCAKALSDLSASHKTVCLKVHMHCKGLVRHAAGYVTDLKFAPLRAALKVYIVRPTTMHVVSAKASNTTRGW